MHEAMKRQIVVDKGRLPSRVLASRWPLRSHPVRPDYKDVVYQEERESIWHRKGRR
jgi:hypothetical protein